MVVSAASGAVGGTVGQIGKIHGCKVIGIAGSNEKCEFTKQEYNFDECLNYKDPNFKENLKIDEGADVDGYLKRLSDNKVKPDTATKQSAHKKADKDAVKTPDKKAVNQN